MGRPRNTAAQKAQTREKKNARRRIARANDATYRSRAKIYQTTFDLKNREKENARKRAWKAANPQQKKINRHRRRALENNAHGRHTAADLAQILIWQNHRCAYCDVSENLHLDHCIPLSRGGSNWPWNLQWLCPHHNISKGDKTDSEYRRLIGLPVQPWVSAMTWSAALVMPIWVFA